MTWTLERLAVVVRADSDCVTAFARSRSFGSAASDEEVVRFAAFTRGAGRVAIERLGLPAEAQALLGQVRRRRGTPTEDDFRELTSFIEYCIKNRLSYAQVRREYVNKGLAKAFRRLIEMDHLVPLSVARGYLLDEDALLRIMSSSKSLADEAEVIVTRIRSRFLQEARADAAAEEVAIRYRELDRLEGRWGEGPAVPVPIDSASAALLRANEVPFPWVHHEKRRLSATVERELRLRHDTLELWLSPQAALDLQWLNLQNLGVAPSSGARTPGCDECTRRSPA